MQQTDRLTESMEHALTTRWRKTIWRPFLSAMQRYQMTQPHDRIAVCISGGKDSWLLAVCLRLLQKHSNIPFELAFLTMDPGFTPEKRAKLLETARRLELPLHVFETDIFRIIQDVKSPCHVCASMRRGNLYHEAQKLGCNKIALGHHMDDAAETVLLGLLYGGEFQAMLPKLYSRNFPGMQLIRPLYQVREARIISWQRAYALPIMACACRVTQREDGGKRREMKTLLAQIERTNPHAVGNIVLSTTRVNLNTVLGWRETRTSPLRSCMQDVLFSQNMDDNAQEMIDSGDASD